MTKCMVVSKNKVKNVNLISSTKIAVLYKGDVWDAVIASTALTTGVVLPDDSEILGIKWNYVNSPLHTVDDWRKTLKNVVDKDFTALIVLWE